MVQIIPAILASEEEGFKKQIDQLLSSSLFQEGWVHIDFMDSKFVPNKSISPSLLSKYNIELKKEAHLMVNHPSSPWIGELEKLSFSRIVIHLESDTEKWIKDNLWYLEDKGIEAGLAINPDTPLEEALQFKNDIDLLLIMGVNPGFQGQQFILETIDKAKRAVQLFKGQYGPKIAVDGGVNQNNVKLLVGAGVDILVVGSFLFNGELDKNLENLLKLTQEGH